MKQIVLRYVAATAAFLLFCNRSEATTLYWTTTDSDATFPVPNKIQKQLLGGGGISDVFVSNDILLGVAADPTVGKIFWTADTGVPVLSAGLDGSNVSTVIASGFDAPRRIAIDAVHGKIYWGDNTAHVIVRSNLDGSDLETVVSSIDTPQGIALDEAGQRLYWTNTTAGVIESANYDGSGRHVVIPSLSSPQDVALDESGGFLYWTDAGRQDVRRARTDGTGVQVLALTSRLPRGIELDPVQQKVYWVVQSDPTGSDFGKIYRSNFDGSSQEVVLSNLDGPFDIAIIVPEPSSIVLGLAAIVLMATWAAMRRDRRPCTE